MIPINSLLFQADIEADMKTVVVVVVVPSSDKVDVKKLEAHLEEDNHDKQMPNSRVSCSLVPADEVESKCGFPPKSVPPIGHAPHDLRILVDDSLYQQERRTILLGGGGHPRIGCLIGAQVLLMLEGTELANLTTAVADRKSDDEYSVKDNTHLSERTKAFPQPTTKPYFALAPPEMSQVEHILSNPDQPNPLKPIAFATVGRINGIRRMAKRLVFCDIAPPDYVGTGTQLDSFDLPWLSALDHSEMSVQLIAGKTFCKNLGDEEGAEAIKNLRVGQLVLVEGKTNVGNRDSLRHWAEKRSLDIVVFNYRLLEGASFQQPRDIRRPGIEPQQSSSASLPLDPKRPVFTNTAYPDPEDCLELSDIFAAMNGDSPIEIVDTIEGVSAFHRQLEYMISSSTQSDNSPLLVGIDCEWKPSFMLESPAEPQPVLLLQVSLQKLQRVYLFDLQSLLRPCLDPMAEQNEKEQAIASALTQLFRSKHLVKVGFQLMTDLRQLAGSYPHIEAFWNIEAVVELGSVCKIAMQMAQISHVRQWTSSLSKLSERFFAKPLNKQQQISDWSSRPLSVAQQEYAALDAAVTPAMLEKGLDLVEARWDDGLRLRRHGDDMAFSRAVSSIRFVFIDKGNPAAVRKLRAKKIVSEEWVVAQTWTTGEDEPRVPSIPIGGNGPYVDSAGLLRVPASALRILNSDENDILKDLVGCRVGKSKDSCLEVLLTQNKEFPEGAKLEYHQRSGYVEFDDFVALFVNMPVRPGEPTPRRGYPNVWLDEGRCMTWFLRDNEWQDGNSGLAQKLIGKISSNGATTKEMPSAVLFVRMDKGGFLCCGKCQIVLPEIDEGMEDKKDWSLQELLLELVDWDRLKSVADFTEMAFTLSSAEIGVR